MSIEIECPKCGARIAYEDEKAGKQDNCLSCGQALIIPPESHQIPKLVEPQPEITETKTIQGFYKAVFIDTWKLFFKSKNTTSLVFVIAVVCFNFFLAKACCCNIVSFIVVWGWLLGFYLNIIHDTAFGVDTLPEIQLGEGFGFLWNIIKPFLIFFFTLLFVMLPLAVVLLVCRNIGIISPETLTNFNDWPLVLKLLFFLCWFLFPSAALATAVGGDFTLLLRPDYLLSPVFKAFGPYIVAVVFLVIAAVIELNAGLFAGIKNETFLSAAGKLTLNLIVQLFAIFAMRSIGLFYRHYACYFKW